LEIVKHHIPIPLEDPALFTQVPEWQSFIANDPLALHTVSSSFLNAGSELDRIVRTHGVRIIQPTLLMLAEDDAIIDNEAVRQRVNQFGTRQLRTQVYAAARHTLEFEPNREEVFGDLVDWLIKT
jgi:alpha-beta hydrolase superfamily lysophospholipase